MEAKLERNYTFLKNKYREFLLPTFFMVMSEKLCIIIDVIIIGFFLGSTQLAIVNLSSPLTYIAGVFYVLFGQGGNLLALRAQSQLQNEKTNSYFTISILGILIISAIILLSVFLFVDNILMFFSVPADLFDISKQYLLTLMFYYPLNSYLLVVSFFVRSDGYSKMPFYAVLTANILNIFFDILFLSVFHWGITSTALASILGYLVGAIYISRYLFKKNASYKLISLTKLKIKEIIISFKEIILNTPETIGKIFYALKMTVLTYLCSSYYGMAGLLALLIYDNSESFVYIFLSGIMKTMSPIVTILYKEKDYDAVHYIIVHSIKQILFISFPLSVLFFVYPEILLSIFNISEPEYAKVVTLAIRITAFSLIGRCMTNLFANYAQATEQNRIASIISLLEEFFFAIVGALVLANILGGIGIWVSILLAECIPVIIYIIYTSRIQKINKNRIKNILMLQNSKLITWTYSRKDIRKIDKYLDEESREILLYIESVFKDKAILISNSMNELCNNLFENNKNLHEIDITIRLIDDELYIVFTSDGKLYNPFLNDSLMKSANIVELSKLNCKLEYGEILGFNKEYIIFKKCEKMNG
ncbi:MAG: hypothetical protein E7Z73_07675 [Methanobrevibacter millerae]|uniref:MatE efflux family protein n=1 Tax=Methanobrevibacter millerae TaxID=230361 RepID=A0A8T3VLP8_9EURY|nr:MATE family efflux transporter [Methanobrevibacter millerae]MBE6505600.1 hypothetical protein [Methanobrevibacter millerae]